MRELVNIKPYDEYISILNEDLLRGDQKRCEAAFIKSTPVITLSDGSTVKAVDIVNAVNNATTNLSINFGRTFRFAEETLNIIYLAHSNKIKTMAVDAHMNLYMNAEFICVDLKMDPELIGAVIMHETFHALYNHIERSINWLGANGKPKNPQTWHDTNLAADVEVNRTLVRTGVISEDRLINEIQGLYLKKSDGDMGVVPLEQILGNEEYMNRLREMCPSPISRERQQPENEIQTSDEWNNGYKDAWNKIAGLIKKYGIKGTWEKLMDAGIINAVGEIYTEKGIDDIKTLEYLTVKSMEEFINENNNVQDSNEGQTYDDGFMNAFGKLVNKMYNAVNPQDEELDDDSSDNSGGGTKLKSNMKDDELDPITFPGNKGKKKKRDEGSEIPENIFSDGGDDGEGENKGKGYSKGGQGKSDDELTDDDINKLSDDINNKTNGGKDRISTHQNIEYGGKGIGGTGSFEDEGLSDDELKDAGYDDDTLDSINKVRENNKFKNSKAGIKKQIERMRYDDEVPAFVRKTLEAIEIESSKYKNIWKNILKEFMAKKTRRAGNDKANGNNDWKNKKAIARGEYGIHHQKTAQDPQDVNVYVDVSGSMDLELLEIISKSLVVFTQQWKYSGINICPWASRSNGVHKVENFYKKSEADVTREILEIISTGESQCGGGTDADAAITAMVDVVVETLSNPEKKKKDDIHVVITDGYFDYQNVENRITRAIKSEINRDDVAEKAPANTIWMIYSDSDSMDDNFKNEWNSEIKKGKIIFINSKVVKNNG